MNTKKRTSYKKTQKRRGKKQGKKSCGGVKLSELDEELILYARKQGLDRDKYKSDDSIARVLKKVPVDIVYRMNFDDIEELYKIHREKETITLRAQRIHRKYRTHTVGQLQKEEKEIAIDLHAAKTNAEINKATLDYEKQKTLLIKKASTQPSNPLPRSEIIQERIISRELSREHQSRKKRKRTPVYIDDLTEESAAVNAARAFNDEDERLQAATALANMNKYGSIDFKVPMSPSNILTLEDYPEDFTPHDRKSKKPKTIPNKKIYRNLEQELIAAAAPVPEHLLLDNEDTDLLLLDNDGNLINDF